MAQECAFDHGQDGGLFVGVELVEGFHAQAQVLGQDDRAAEGLAVAVRDLGDRGDLAAQRFRVFVGAFEERTGLTVVRAGR